MARTLIIGAMEGYRFEQVAPFFRSLRDVGYGGEVLIFSRGIDAECRASLEEGGARVIELPRKGLRNPLTGRVHSGQGRFGDLLALWLRTLRNVPATPETRDSWTLHFARHFFHIANLRFVAGAQYLREHLDAYDLVMITDVRDVIFQAAPFVFDGVEKLSTFLEGPEITVDSSRNYREWIESAFGSGEAAKFAGMPLSCCAITIGPARPMLNYLTEMAGLIVRNFTRQPYLFGLDSAAHNFIRLHGKVPGLVTVGNLDGPVAHLGTVKREEIVRDAQGRLLNRKGAVVNIVHQYDRHPGLMEPAPAPRVTSP